MCAFGASPATKSSRDVSSSSSSSSQSPKISQIQKKTDSSSPRSCRISFSDDIKKVFWIPRMDVAEVHLFFYDDEEIAQFRHEAWCATIGLNSTDFSVLEKEVDDDDDLDTPSVHAKEVISRVRTQEETPRLTNAEEETTATEIGPKAKLLDGKSREEAHAKAARNLDNAAVVEEPQCPPPNATDVCLDVQDHPGTLVFLQIVKTSLHQIGDVDYSPPVYKLIKKQLKGRRMVICVNNTKKPSYWRDAAQAERIDYVGKCFEDERSKLRAMRMKRKGHHVSEPPKKKYKPHGCDGV
jgi:hypothetical protein